MDRSVLIRASILLLPAPWPSGVPIEAFSGAVKTSWGRIRRFMTPEDIGRLIPLGEIVDIQHGSWIDVRVGECVVRLVGAESGTEDFTVAFELLDPSDSAAEERYSIYGGGVVRPSRGVEFPSLPFDDLRD